MKACKSFYDKLLFFDDLDCDEQKKVRLHTEQCETCRQQLQEFQAITSSLQSIQFKHHLNEELLVRYSIYLAEPKVPDYDGRKLTQSEIVHIQKHTTECQQCQTKVQQLCQEYSEIEAYLEETDLPALSLARRSPWSIVSNKVLPLYRAIKDTIENIIFLPVPKLYPIAVGAMAVLLLTIWFGPFFRGSDNPYLALVTLQQERTSVLTRSGMPEELHEGLAAFQKGRYPQAIQDLEHFIANNSSHPSLFYAHYVLGISYLMTAKTDFLGRFQKVDTKLVNTAILNFQMTRDLTTNSGIREDCNWYIANAYLMIGAVNKAKDTLDKVLNVRGRRFKEAKEIIKELDTIENSQ